MNKLLLSLLLFGAATASLTSCKRDQVTPAPAADTVPLALPQPSADPSKRFYNLVAASAAANTNPTRPVFEFTLAPGSNGNTQLASIFVYKSFRSGGLLRPRMLVGEYSDFPVTISFVSQDILAGVTRANGNPVIATNPASRNQLLVNDALVFTFDYKVADGTVFTTTPLDGTGTITPANSTFAVPPYSIVAEFRNR